MGNPLAEGPKLKVGQYLSTNLITGPNITLADIGITNYTAELIEEMETQLTGQVSGLKWQPLLVDPKAEAKRAKQEGDMETLVGYHEIAEIAEQAH
jgi:hypothetical protein